MALQDPDAPLPLDPGLLAALEEQRNAGPYSWVPDHWDTGEPGGTTKGTPPDSMPLAINTSEYGQTATPPAPTPPPPPPPPVKQVGTTDAIDQGIAGLPGMPPPAQPPPPDAISGAGPLDAPVSSLLGSPVGMDRQLGPLPPPSTDTHTLGSSASPGIPSPSGGEDLSASQPPTDTAFARGDRDAHKTDAEIAAEDLDLAINHPLEYAAKKKAWEEDRRAHLTDRLAEEEKTIRDHQQMVQQHYDEGQKRADQALAEVNADAKKLSATKIDQGHWWATRSTGQKVAAYIAAIVGGLAAGRTGGPNVGMALIQKAIDDDIDVQKANMTNARADIAGRRGAVNDMYARNGDMLRAEATMRSAAWESVAKQLEIEGNQYDKRGTKAFAIADSVLQARSNSQAALQKFNDENQKRERERVELQIKQQAQLEAARHNKADERNTSWKTAIEDRQSKLQYGKGGYEDRKLTLEEQTAAAKAAKGDPEAEKLLLERGVYELDNDKSSPTFGQVVPIMTKDPKTGKQVPFLIKGEGRQVNEFATKKTGTDRSIELIDQIINRGPAWMSDLKNSDKLNQMKGDTAALQLELMEAYNVKSITELHLEMLEKLAKDPTGIKDPTALLKETRANLVARMNGEYERQNIGKPYVPPKTDVKDPTPTSSDQQINAVIKGDWKDNREAINSMYGLAITSPDPNVRDANLRALQKIGEEATNEETRDTAKRWAAGATARQPAPEWKPGSEIVTTDRSGPTVTVKFADGSYKQMSTAEAIKVTTGPGGG